MDKINEYFIIRLIDKAVIILKEVIKENTKNRSVIPPPPPWKSYKTDILQSVVFIIKMLNSLNDTFLVNQKCYQAVSFTANIG